MLEIDVYFPQNLMRECSVLEAQNQLKSSTKAKIKKQEINLIKKNKTFSWQILTKSKRKLFPWRKYEFLDFVGRIPNTKKNT